MAIHIDELRFDQSASGDAQAAKQALKNARIDCLRIITTCRDRLNEEFNRVALKIEEQFELYAANMEQAINRDATPIYPFEVRGEPTELAQSVLAQCQSYKQKKATRQQTSIQLANLSTQSSCISK